MKKASLFLCLLLLVVGVIGISSNAAFAYSENTATEDMLRFKYEYEALNNQPNAAGMATMMYVAIPEFNLIQFTTPEEILEIAQSGTGLIFFGFPQCPWCRQMAPLLIDVALSKGLDAIHYIDMTTVRTTWVLQDGVPVMTDPGHPLYQELLVEFASVIEPMDLNPFHLTDQTGNRVNTGELRIFVPTVVAIREGVIVGSHVYTVPASAPGNAYGNHWNPLSNDETKYLRTIYESLVMALISPPAPNLETASSWARDSISLAVNRGLVPESLQSNYRLTTTRAEFAALAAALYTSIAGDITGRVTFTDTTDINVEKMAYLGVVQGVGRNLFAPDREITRQEAAVFLMRLVNAIGHQLPHQASTFADNQNISSWAMEGVGQMQASGIMSGVSGNRFSPQGPYTREQSIVTMLRVYTVIYELQPTPTPTPVPEPVPTPTPTLTPIPNPTPTPPPTPEPTPDSTSEPTPEPSPGGC
ncbi:MAG: S-layer homology domain-containing protein [Defluviitaleaceae bacterium]|nr:S-layer homology domain-containing protein [Defluviitaleaceae bacterium]